jgi:hypothetical protein
LGLIENQTIAVRVNDQGGLIMRILRRMLMVLVMMVLIVNPRKKIKAGLN